MFTLNHQPPSAVYSARLTDTALHNLMRQVYVWMALGMLVTAGTAFYTLHSWLLNLAFQSGALMIAMLIEFGLVIGLSIWLRQISPAMAGLLFFIYAAINGFTLSVLLYTFGLGTAFTAFLTTAALFGLMSVFAYTTPIDLSRMGTYLVIGITGLMIAMAISVFTNSNALDLLISAIGVVIFTGLTAYDTQRIAQLAAAMGADSSDSAAHFAIFGALKLYLDFINLFIFLLRLTNSGRRH